VGEWIPEPLPAPREWISGRADGTTADPADRVTLDESIDMAFLVVLESMTPAERVAFILHDVFRYSFSEVAEIVGRTPAACRQLASSARRRIRESQAPTTPTAQRADLIKDFKQAWEVKDIAALVGLLDPDATAIADSGGLAAAHLRPIEGSEQIARTYVDIAGRAPDLTLLERTVNGQPGLVAQIHGVTVTVYAFGSYAIPRNSACGRRADLLRQCGPGPLQFGPGTVRGDAVRGRSDRVRGHLTTKFEIV
jgi:hypothetical protein